MEFPPLTTGWYPDPSGSPGTLRYYQDYAWTERTAVAPPGAPGVEYFDVPSYLRHLTLPPLPTNLDGSVVRNQPTDTDVGTGKNLLEKIRPAWEAFHEGFADGARSSGAGKIEWIAVVVSLAVIALALLIRKPTTTYLAVIAAVVFYLAITRRKRRSRTESRYIPRDVLGEVFRRDDGCCVECGSTESLEVDHIIPYSRGGATSADNLQLLCRECNRRKSNNI